MSAIEKTQCLKITQNVPFEFLNFGIFHHFCPTLKVTILVTLFDRKFYASKFAKIDHFWQFSLTSSCKPPKDSEI